MLPDSNKKPSAKTGAVQFDITGLTSLSNSVLLAIDFVDGDGVSNSVKVKDIITDGTSSSVSLVGGAFATVDGYSLDDTSLFNSVSIEYINANQLGFKLDVTNNAPASGMSADTLAVYLLDAMTGQPLIFTDEGLGLNALFSWTATGAGQGSLAVYNELIPSAVSWSANLVTPRGPNNATPVPGLTGLWLLVQIVLILLMVSGIYTRRVVK